MPAMRRSLALLAGMVATAAWLGLAAPAAPAFTHAQKRAFRQTVLKEKHSPRATRAPARGVSR